MSLQVVQVYNQKSEYTVQLKARYLHNGIVYPFSTEHSDDEIRSVASRIVNDIGAYAGMTLEECGNDIGEWMYVTTLFIDSED